MGHVKLGVTSADGKTWTGNAKLLTESAAYPMDLAATNIKAWEKNRALVTPDLIESVRQWRWCGNLKNQSQDDMENASKERPTKKLRESGSQGVHRSAHIVHPRGQAVRESGSQAPAVNPWGDFKQLAAQQVQPDKKGSRKPKRKAAAAAPNCTSANNPWGDIQQLADLQRQQEEGGHKLSKAAPKTFEKKRKAAAATSDEERQAPICTCNPWGDIAALGANSD